MSPIQKMQIDRNARASRALVDLGNKIGNRIAALWLDKRGQLIRHLVPELAQEAIGGIGLAMAEQGISLSVLIGGQIPREVMRAGFSAAQAVLRKMSRTQSLDVISWDESMRLADDDSKPMLDALHDSLRLRDQRAAIIAKGRGMIRAARAFHKVNASRKRDAALRADLRNIRRATSYMIRHVLGDSSQPYEFKMAMRWNESERSMTNATRETFQLTAKRVCLGSLALK